MAKKMPLERIGHLHAYWRATNYLGSAQLYLKETPLLQEPLVPGHKVCNLAHCTCVSVK